ncbi:MAG: recombinase family protein [Thermofilum sp.]
MKAFGYIRVSTRDQDEDVQRRAIEEFARSRGIEVLGFYVDKVSGASAFRERPEGSRLVKDLEAERVDAVVVWSIDRLGRSMIDTLNTVIELENRGIRVLSVKEEWLQTLDENVRKLLLSVLAWFAEFERKRIRERQLEAWSQGKQKGRPRKLRPEAVERYLKKYNTLPLSSILKIMRADGINVSYSTLRNYVKELGYHRVFGNWVKVLRSTA